MFGFSYSIGGKSSGTQLVSSSRIIEARKTLPVNQTVHSSCRYHYDIVRVIFVSFKLLRWANDLVVVEKLNTTLLVWNIFARKSVAPKRLRAIQIERLNYNYPKFRSLAELINTSQEWAHLHIYHQTFAHGYSGFIFGKINLAQ